MDLRTLNRAAAVQDACKYKIKSLLTTGRYILTKTSEEYLKTLFKSETLPEKVLSKFDAIECVIHPTDEVDNRTGRLQEIFRVTFSIDCMDGIRDVTLLSGIVRQMSDHLKILSLSKINPRKAATLFQIPGVSRKKPEPEKETSSAKEVSSQ